MCVLNGDVGRACCNFLLAENKRAKAHRYENKIMKNKITVSALLALFPLTVNAYVDNIYGNGGVETQAFSTEAEAISAANIEMENLKEMSHEELAFTLRTPHKNLKYNSVEIVDTEVKTREKDGQFKGFVDVEYRFARIKK
jgi:hypothetical protein